MSLKNFVLAVLVFISLETFAQEDTITVQVIEFSDLLDNRRAWRFFPPDTAEYRQVLMYQTLKCSHPLIPNPTNSGCGEWDTGENFYIYDHSHADSNRYRTGFTYPDSILTRSTPVFDTYNNYQYHIVYDVTANENSYTVGTGSKLLNHSLQSSLHSNRSQYLYLGSDLTATGLDTGNIDKVQLNVTSLGLANLENLSIRMKHTALSSLDENNFESSGFTTVYRLNTSILSTGLHTFNLTVPFNWDGNSNIVVDFSFSNAANGADFSISGDTTSYLSGVFTVVDDRYYDFHHNGYIDVETSNLRTLIDSNITISFWTETDLSHMGTGHFVPFSSTDTLNIYQLLGYLPSTAPRVHWYAGREFGAGLDEIKNAANLPDHTDFEDGWTHWAYTRNSSTTEMRVYRNGQLYLQGNTGNNKRILNQLYNFRIGADRSSNNRFYGGKMNEFRIWNTDLDSNTIQDWMYRDLNGNHPNSSNLVGYFQFNNNGNPVDGTGNSKSALFGMPSQQYIPGDERFRNFAAIDERPTITFIQGSYTSHIDSNLIVTQVEKPQISIVVSQNYQDLSKTGYQDIETDTLYLWESGYSYTYDANENKIDSTFNAPDKTYINWYSGHQTMLAKYITPYGNFLDLGDGFTWVYDVTELEDLLHDTLDLSGGGNRELIDLKFKFIEGIPPQNVNKIEWLHNVGGKYADIVANPQNYYNRVNPDPSSTRFGIRASFSGHGFNNSTNCAEFCQRTHFIEVDGNRAYAWTHWKECADNPLYPQGGTWIYDRSGWCPGAPQDIYHFDLTDQFTPPLPKTIFKGVDPDGTQYGNWGGFMYFFSYGEPNFENDATVYDIISPSLKQEHLRFNPICDNAQIILRNNGSNQLTQAMVQYGVKGGTSQFYNWTGSLEFMETETVVLPMHGFGPWSGTERKFYARITGVNNGRDEYIANDQYETSFLPPPLHPHDIKLILQTNNAAFETSWDVRDGNGNVLYSGFGLANNTFYSEDFSFPSGCYTLNIYDSGDDGLSFWNNNDGHGFVNLRDGNNIPILSFEPDFGNNIRYEFTVGGILSVYDEEKTGSLFVYPNPSAGIYNIALENLNVQKVRVTVVDMLGKTVFESNNTGLNNSDHWVGKIDISHVANGMYTVVITTDNHTFTKRVQKM